MSSALHNLMLVMHGCEQLPMLLPEYHAPLWSTPRIVIRYLIKRFEIMMKQVSLC